MRALIFTDVAGASARLIPETLRLARARGDLEVCGVVSSRPERFRADRARAARDLLQRLLVAACNRDVPWRTVLPATLDLTRLERTQGIPLLVPPGGDPNDAHFIERLTRDLRPQLALSYECLSIFRKPLLQVFEQAVNYHAGLLPHYRGVMATSFSIFAGEAQSGFSFHRMTERVDRGPILVQGAVPVAGASAEEVSRRKLELVVAALPQVLEKVIAGDPGQLPAGAGSHYYVRDWQALIRVDDPGYVTEAQLRQRIRAFGIVHLTIGGREYPVTRVRPSAPERPLAFRTADRQVLAPDRLNGLPRVLYRWSARPSGT